MAKPEKTKAEPSTEFFRLKRKSTGWLIEAVSVRGTELEWRKDICEWDLLTNIQRKLMTKAAAAERDWK